MADEQLFDIYLEPADDSGGQLRVTNHGGNEVQRQHIVDRTNALTVQADLVEAVHGSLSDDADELATLVIMDFRG